MSDKKKDISQILKDINSGKASAANDLLPKLYDYLKGMASNYMRYENNNHTLQATSLVHEAYVKLIDQDKVKWQSRTHFLAISANIMRRILVDHARTKNRIKRGGDKIIVGIEVAEWSVLSNENDNDVLTIDTLLKRLEEIDFRQAKIVEMRFFSGMQVQEVADALGVSKRTVEGDWTMAKAWLRKELNKLNN